MLVRETNYSVEGNMPGEVHSTTVDTSSLEHIMDVLSDLYADKVGAIVREYITNALDSHTISAQMKPVEITTPSRFSPNLVIRDYGEGMSKQTLIDVFNQYGSSTKRNNNLETGRLGLGAKSAYAYTDQFTIRSINQGYCCELILSRNSRGAAEMNIAFEYDTDEPDGVTVTIPIKTYDVLDAVASVRKFAGFAEQGTLLIDGVLNKRPSDWIKVAENVYHMPNEHSTDYVVMGNVAYPTTFFSDVYAYNKPRLVAFVEMGEIDFPPSREAVKNTPHSVGTIKKIEQYVADSIQQNVASVLAKDIPRHEKVKAYSQFIQWERFANHSSTNGSYADQFEFLTKNTERLTFRLPYDINNPNDRMRNHAYNTPRKMHLTDLQRHSSQFYAVVDFDATKVSRDQARKIIATDSDYAGKTVYFFKASKSDLDDLFENWTVISWDDIKSIRTPKPAVSRSRTITQKQGKYRGIMVHNRRVFSNNPTLMKPTGRAFYCSQREYNELDLGRGPRGDYKIFIVPPSRQEVFKKKNPDIEHFNVYVQRRYQQICNHIKNNDLVAGSIDYSGRYGVFNDLNKLDYTKITNDDFKELIRKARRGNKWTGLRNQYYGVGDRFVYEVRDKFPLLLTGRAYQVDPFEFESHAISYINMIGEKNVNA